MKWDSHNTSTLNRYSLLLTPAGVTATDPVSGRVELQKLADELGFPISVCHYRPGTSKWNKVEHQLFSFITQNWWGKPLYSHIVIVNLISSTTTQTGLTVKCRIDENFYAKGCRVTDKELAEVNLHPDEFHGEWNYSNIPKRKKGKKKI